MNNKMEIQLQLFNKYDSLIGFSYKAGTATTKNEEEEVFFHEFGIGLIFISLYITVY